MRVLEGGGGGGGGKGGEETCWERTGKKEVVRANWQRVLRSLVFQTVKKTHSEKEKERKRRLTWAREKDARRRSARAEEENKTPPTLRDTRHNAGAAVCASRTVKRRKRTLRVRT